MENMSYCMFENTVRAMNECIDGVNEFNPKEASKYELEAFKEFYELCVMVAEDYEEDFRLQEDI